MLARTVNGLCTWSIIRVTVNKFPSLAPAGTVSRHALIQPIKLDQICGRTRFTSKQRTSETQPPNDSVSLIGQARRLNIV